MEKLNASFDDLQKFSKIEQIGSTLHEKPNYGTIVVNLLIIIKKGVTPLKMCSMLDISTQTLINHLSLGYWNL